MTPIILAAAVTGQTACFPATEMPSVLFDRYGERPVLMAMEYRGAAVQLFTAPNGTWTMVAIDQEDLACVVAWGTALTFAPAFGG